jgi:hypothetical protein
LSGERHTWSAYVLGDCDDCIHGVPSDACRAIGTEISPLRFI